MNIRTVKWNIEDFIGRKSNKYIREEKKFYKYIKMFDNDKLSIFQRVNHNEKIVAAYGSTVISLNYQRNKIIMYPYGFNKKIKHSICLNDDNFPGLIKDSFIDNCLLIPYMRVIKKDKYIKSLRLIVITNNAQIYHNNPSRDILYEGTSIKGDIVKFEESAIWDLPNNFYPSNIKDCSETEVFYPGLPQSCYEYHPLVNTDPRFEDIYKNGGFSKYNYVNDKEGKEGKKIVSRFYIYNRELASSPFHYIGGTEIDEKMHLIGTYRNNANSGVRTCLFATDDGGRNWFCKYEFSDLGEYEFKQGNIELFGLNHGNPIKNYKYENSYRSGEIQIRKRNLILPCEEKLNNTNLFQWESGLDVKKILDTEYITLETVCKHNLRTGNIIALNSKAQNKDYLWMINNEIETNSIGNGMLFKVCVIDDYTIQLYECVSKSQHNIACRHIHHVNRIKDGWLIGTGEIYPNGWVLYMQMKESDTFTIKKANDFFEIYRLNTTRDSIQRSMGALLIDDEKHTMLFASDHDLLSRDNIIIDENTTISRSSTGLFMGDLSIINDFSKWKCILEMKEPCFLFQKIDNVFFYFGQRGSFAIGTKLDNLTIGKLDKTSFYYFGKLANYYIFDDFVFLIKE